MRHIDSETLAVLIAVSDTHSFTTAAELLGKTQAAVSMCVSRTEDKLQKRLFDRTRQGVFPTALGQNLIVYARRIVALEAEALSFVTDTVAGARVRMAMPDDYMQLVGGLILRDFLPHHREIYIDLNCDFSSRLTGLLDTGQLDLALTVCHADAPLRGEMLFRNRQLWCTGPTGHPEDDDCLRLALFSEDCSARPRILAALERQGRPWRMMHSSSHLSGVLMAAASGRMLTVLPECAIPEDWRIVDPGPARLPAIPDAFMTLRTRESPSLAARRITAFLRDAFAGLRDVRDYLPTRLSA